jgi:glycosyltransferase involved in cell wall biosynthesis
MPPRTTLAPVVRAAARPGCSGPAAVEVMVDTLDMGSARAAVICPVLPYPPVGGGHKRTLRLLEAMKRVEVTPQIVTTDGSRPDGVAELRDRGWSVDVVEDAAVTARARLRQHLARRPSPYIPAVAARVRQLVAEGSAFVQVEHTQSAYYERDFAGTPWVLSLHNVDSELMQSVAREERPLTLSWLRASSRWRSLRAVERRAVPRADAVLCVSEADAAAFTRHAREVVVAGNGVDDAFFAVPAELPGEERILFFGQYDYQPNAQGIARFVSEGWPIVAAARPAARLRLAGKGMGDALRRLVQRSERVEAIGFVEDLAAELAASRLVLVPIWSGGGTRLKVLESLAAARPVVGTPLGVERIGFEAGRHGLVADTAAELGRAAVELLEQDARATSLAEEGRRLADRFRWTRTTAPAERLYRRLAYT